MTQKIKNPLFGLESLFFYTAGLQLLGTEVKSIKTGQGSLRGASCVVRGGEVFLLGANIPAYQNKNAIKSYEPTRARKLLLNKKEIKELVGYEQRKDLDITPLEVYNSGRAIKLKIAITRKLKRHDKREKIKKKESDRSIRRLFKK